MQVIRAVSKRDSKFNTDRMITIKQLYVIWQYIETRQLFDIEEYSQEELEQILNEINEILTQ